MTKTQDLDWLHEPEPEPSAPSPLDTAPLQRPGEDMPDWLEGLKPMQDEPEGQEPQPSAAEQSASLSQVPDWLQELGQDKEDTESHTVDTEPEPSMPQPHRD